MNPEKSLLLLPVILVLLFGIFNNLSRTIKGPVQLIGQECVDWAFGKESGSEPVSEIDTLWNERHGDLFLIKGSDNYEEAMRRIKEACWEIKKI